ncbi:MAG: hypothetical protein NC820_04415, partial [Candidatus Omnitrophica bacterium]|nr:hypothetical protein [Candidatus Omnitrophota bacterium]
METYEIKLKDIAKLATEGKYTDLFTREIGRSVFLRLEEEIRRTKEGCVVVIDFLEIGAIDYSCADEIFARLILNLQHRDY